MALSTGAKAPEMTEKEAEKAIEAITPADETVEERRLSHLKKQAARAKDKVEPPIEDLPEGVTKNSRYTGVNKHGESVVITPADLAGHTGAEIRAKMYDLGLILPHGGRGALLRQVFSS